jgi:hypothetical protein
MEAVSKKSYLQATDWPAWSPSPELLQVTAAVALLMGLWTCGLPGFLLDLWSGTRLAKRDIIWLGLGSLWLGPMAALPLLATLELGLYLFVCCFWAGFCLFITYLVVAFRTKRALPRLAVDFVGLSIVLGLLEWLARGALGLPGPAAMNSALTWLVGHLGFSSLAQSLGLLCVCFLFFLTGLLGMARSYRSSGGREVAAGMLALALLGGVVAVDSLELSEPAVPIQDKFEQLRTVYLLGSTQENPWALSSISYSPLEVSESLSGFSPQAAGLRLASRLLDWDEEGALRVLGEWGQQAPGVTWGMVSAVDSFGERTQSVLEVDSEARRKTVSQLLQNLHWRRLDDVVLSEHTGAVSGKLVKAGKPQLGVRLRLIEVGEQGGVSEALERLEQEQAWARRLVTMGTSELHFPFPSQRVAVTDEGGRFRFSRLPEGRYFLALLLDDPADMTLNSSIPGLIQVTGDEVDLQTLRLTTGEEGSDVELRADRWKAQGKVLFSENSELHTARLTSGASVTGFVDTKVYGGGEALIKVKVEGPPGAEGTLTAQFYTKDGRFIQEWSSGLSTHNQIDELQVDSGGREGYLQLTVRATRGPLTLRRIKLEVLSRG